MKFGGGSTYVVISEVTYVQGCAVLSRSPKLGANACRSGAEGRQAVGLPSLLQCCVLPVCV